MKRMMIFSLIAFSSVCYGKEAPETIPPPSNANPYTPWFTGPILTPSPTVVRIGNFNIEPYVYYGSTNAQYNSEWGVTHTPTFSQLRIQVPIQVGLTKWMDITITPQVINSWCQGASKVSFCDFPLQFDFQLLSDQPGWNWHPSLKFAVRESFPVGKYQHLNPNRHKTDISGSGSFITSFSLVVGKMFPVYGIHYLNTRFNVTYNYPAPVHVRGFNTYGGGYSTAGKVYPGNIFNFFLGLEYSLTHRWVLALDAACTVSSKTRFKGQPGFTTPGGTIATVGQQPVDPLGIGSEETVVGGPSSMRFSLAPALEYNWSSHLGIIVGAIASVAGRNSVRFATGVAALNYYY